MRLAQLTDSAEKRQSSPYSRLVCLGRSEWVVPALMTGEIDRMRVLETWAVSAL